MSTACSYVNTETVALSNHETPGFSSLCMLTFTVMLKHELHVITPFATTPLYTEEMMLSCSGYIAGAATQTGKAVGALQDLLPNARVLYSSATGASEPNNLGYMYRLGAAGFDHMKDMIETLNRYPKLRPVYTN